MNSRFLWASSGWVLGVLVAVFYFQFSPSVPGENDDEPTPLYWVAPMDSNYRSDGPGKSPMGMDLVPVYAEDSDTEDENVVTISPSVENNLGVRTAAVKEGVLDLTINTVGYVRYDENNIVHMHPRVEGWIEKLYVKALGDPVKKGQAVYDIYSPELVNAQEEYLLTLVKNNPRIIKAAEDKLNALLIPRRAIKALRETRQVQQTVTFYAPQNGVVDHLNIREGFFVQPGTTLLSIASLDPIWVETEIYEHQFDQIQKGQSVLISTNSGEKLSSLVDYIYPSLEPITRTIVVRSKLTNTDHKLKSQMYVDVDIPVANTKRHLLIPRSAVIRTEKSTRAVVSLGEGKFKSLEIRIGRSNREYTEVLSGLKKNDEVVVSSQFLLDSESNRSADLGRMETPEKKILGVKAVIMGIDEDSATLTLNHAPIPQLDWPEMLMDFFVAEDIALSSFKEGDAVVVSIMKSVDGHYIIGQLEMDKAEAPNSRAENKNNRSGTHNNESGN